MNAIEKIEELLNQRGWSRYKLAKESGLSQSTVVSLFSGRVKNPSTESLAKIADALGVSTDYLLGKELEDRSLDGTIKHFFRLIGKAITERAPFAGRIESDLWANIDELVTKHRVGIDVKIDAHDPRKFDLIADALCGVEDSNFKADILNMVKQLASKYHLWENPVPSEETGMNFYGGSEKYTTDEIEVMEAALKAYREQKKKLMEQMKDK